MDTNDILNDLLNNFNSFSIEDLPDIELYMDQVTTLINRKFENMGGHDDGRRLTKTMINNYAKFKILPAPEKKKYSKDHLIILIMINFFKNVLSINDTGRLIEPLVALHYHNGQEPLQDIVGHALEIIHTLDEEKDIKELQKKCLEALNFETYEDEDYLNKLAFITLLLYQAYIRQQLAVRLIDSLSDSDDDSN